MKAIKIKLSELENNPYQSNELDGDQVEKLITSMKGVGFMGIFELQQHPKTHKYHMVFGHHRKAAAQKLFGKHMVVDALVRDWDEDKLMRGKSNENLTSTKDPKRLIREINDIRNYLKGNGLSIQNPDRKLKSTGGRPKGSTEAGSLNEIDEWLNKFGTIATRSTIADLLNINDNLAPELMKRLDKGATNTEEDDDHINLTNAAMLAKLDDHKEQREVWKAFQDSSGPRMHRVRTRQKIITQYKEVKKKAASGDKNAKQEIEAIRKGKKDIAAVGLGVGFNEDLIMKPSAGEQFMHIEDSLFSVQEDMKFNDKNFDKVNMKVLEKHAIALKSFVKNGLGPYSTKLFEKLKGGVYFTISEDEQ